MRKKHFFFPAAFMLFTMVGQAQIGSSNTIGAATVGHAVVGGSTSIGKSDLPICTPGSVACTLITAYVFNGNGYWNIAANWLGNVIPPQVLPAGHIILIDPVPGGECVLNVMQTISDGATLTLLSERRLKVLTTLLFLK